MGSIITDQSQAFARTASAENQVFEIGGENIESKILVGAPYDPLKTTITPNVPIRILNGSHGGDLAGYGQPAHRLLEKVFKGTGGAGTVYWSPQEDDAGAVVADGEIAWSGAPTSSGTIYLRIANELYSISIASGLTLEQTSQAVVDAVNAVADCPVIAALTAVSFETTFTAKSKGAAGNDIIITLSADQSTTPGESLPTGLTAIITDMVNGVGLPDIDDTLGGMGVADSDEANEQGFTQLLHYNGIDTDTIDKIDAYVGSANSKTGCWSETVIRPFLYLTGDTTSGSAGLDALEVISDARDTQQSGGILGVPDEDEIPSELAAQAAGYIGAIHQKSPATNYSETILSGVGGRSISANRWTRDYTSGRDFAVKEGISPTAVTNKTVSLQNVVTFYRPGSTPTASNGWKSFRSFFVQYNIIKNLRAVYASDAYKGFFITKDKSLVTQQAAADNAVDEKGVYEDLVSFIDNYLVPWGLIYDGQYAKDNSTVTLRAGGNGFNVVLKDYESGEGQIIVADQKFDKNIALAS